MAGSPWREGLRSFSSSPGIWRHSPLLPWCIEAHLALPILWALPILPSHLLSFKWLISILSRIISQLRGRSQRFTDSWPPWTVLGLETLLPNKCLHSGPFPTCRHVTLRCSVFFDLSGFRQLWRESVGHTAGQCVNKQQMRGEASIKRDLGYRSRGRELSSIQQNSRCTDPSAQQSHF